MARAGGIIDRLRNAVRKAGIYQRAKVSWIYDVYWTLADRQIVDDKRGEIEFYRSVLGGFRPGNLIFDVGANIGYKADIFLRLGAHVVAAEPDQSCQRILRQKFLEYRFKKKSLVLVGKAVSDGSSAQRMWVDTPGSAKNTLSTKWADTLRSDDSRFGQKLDFAKSIEVETVSVDQLIATYGAPFYVKIDVEGFELNVLRGMRQAVPYVSFEVNLPEFEPEGLECVRTLARNSPNCVFNYTRDCRDGLALSQWLGPEEFLPVLSACHATSIDVFCKTPMGGTPVS